MLRSLLTLGLATQGHAADDSTEANVYVAPSVEGLHWADTFDGDALSRWIISGKGKYDGVPEVSKRRVEGLIGDMGLLMPTDAKSYGISSTFPELAAGRSEPFILQYETRFQDALQCGGGYVKVFDRGQQDAKDFDNETPYVIMFGPDRCGGTDKIHFILKHQNPKSGIWEEKHFKEPPSVPHDDHTHLFGLVIKSDNSFEIQLDGKSKATGNLLTSMEPPINPAKEIDDPEDSRPSDWIDDAKMADPESKKPDEWDEEEPRMIVDESAKIPSGWREDEEKRIADPDSQKPDDWDDEEDGEWEAPTIDNANCKVGCGKWHPPKISNPKYKGLWSAAQIDNPEYKGVWKARIIANPDYFNDETPSSLPKINAVGIDIWTMQGGILYDNFVISTDLAIAKQFTANTFDLRQKIEGKQNPSSSGSGILDKLKDNPIPVAITLLVVVLGTIYLCMRGGAEPPQPPPAEKKPTNGAKMDTKDNTKDEQDEDNDEGKDDVCKEDKEPEDEADSKDDKPADGGVGLDDGKSDD